jgi:plastocyanin
MRRLSYLAAILIIALVVLVPAAVAQQPGESAPGNGLGEFLQGLFREVMEPVPDLVEQPIQGIQDLSQEVAELVPAAVAQQPGESAQGDAVVVSIQDNYFQPPDITVAVGTTVWWVNEGQNQHSVTADNGLFDSGPLKPGESYWVTFEGQGKVTYHCSPDMRGSVTVGDGGAEGGTVIQDDQVGVQVANGADGADGADGGENIQTNTTL